MLTNAESTGVAYATSAPPRRIGSRAFYGSLVTGTLGGLLGLVIGLALWPLPLAGSWMALGSIAALASGVVAAIAAGLGYWRVRDRAGDGLSAWTVFMNTTAVVVVHAFLAMIATLAIFFTCSALA